MKGFYKYIHKIHHNFPAPIGMASEYAHPVCCVLGASATPPARSAVAHTQIEFFVGNSLPILVGPLLTGAHCQLLWFWIMIAISATCNGSRRWCSRVANSVLTGGSCAGHSGYLLPFSPFHDARNHDYHHSRFKVCAFVTVCVRVYMGVCITVSCCSAIMAPLGSSTGCTGQMSSSTRTWSGKRPRKLLNAKQAMLSSSGERYVLFPSTQD